MIESALRHISDIEGGEYSIEYYKVIFTDGSRYPETLHKIKFLYKDCTIQAAFKTGYIDSGKVECLLSKYIQPVTFDIDSVSHFQNLFFRRKSRFKIKCNNKYFKDFFKSKALLVFKKSIDEKNFNPRMYSIRENSNNKIIIEFHLGIPNWTDTFKESISFLKLLIDELYSDNRIVSNSFYRENN